jgi:hypothetical protein
VCKLLSDNASKTYTNEEKNREQNRTKLLTRVRQIKSSSRLSNDTNKLLLNDNTQNEREIKILRERHANPIRILTVNFLLMSTYY